jgi:hypothetical protein
VRIATRTRAYAIAPNDESFSTRESSRRELDTSPAASEPLQHHCALRVRGREICRAMGGWLMVGSGRWRGSVSAFL